MIGTVAGRRMLNNDAPSPQPGASPPPPPGVSGPPPSIPALSASAGKLVETVFSVDPEEAFRLAGDFSIGDALTPEAVRAALERCEASADLAQRCYLAIRLEQEAFEFRAAIVESEQRDKALAALFAEKDAGVFRGKDIREKDVEARVAAMFPAETRTIRENRSRLAALSDYLRRRAELWKQRSYTLAAVKE